MKKFIKKRESRKQVLTHPLHPDKLLVTRRDFLSSGLLGFAGTAMIPSLLTTILFEQRAMATLKPPPFILFDLGGGYNAPGNFMPLDPNGALLGNSSNYTTVGLGAGGYVADYSFGIPMAAPNLTVTPQVGAPSTITLTATSTNSPFSQIYGAMTGFANGTTTSLNPAILGTRNDANTNLINTSPRYSPAPGKYPMLQMGGIPLNSMSDSQSNVTSPLGFISAAGLQGSMVQTGLGTTAAQSGGNSAMGEALATFKPLQIQSSQALPAALGYGATLKSLGQNTLNNIANALQNLTSTQTANLNTMTNGQQMAALMSSGLVTNAGYTTTVTGIDPFQDTDASSIYGLSGQSTTSQDAVNSTLVLNAVMGNSGPVVITIGGCDYHDQTQTTGDAKDVEIGTQFVKAMNLAYAKMSTQQTTFTKVIFGFITDGGIYTGPGGRVYMGDDNQHGHVIMGVLDITGTTKLSRLSVGGYVNNTNPDGSTTQTADPTNPISNDPLKVCHVMGMNYMALSGMLPLAAGGVSNYVSFCSSQFPRDASLLPNLYPNLQAMANACLLFPTG